MDHYKWSLRAGAAMILCAFLLRLTATGFFMPMVQLLTKPNIASIIIYLETGRVVRFSDSLGDSTGFVPVFYQTPPATEPPEETVPTETPVFTAAEVKAVEVLGTERTYDAGALMEKPLDWDLTGPEPTVLILHTHATESFTRSAGERYTESSAFRTLSEDYNMVSVGDRVAELLKAGGVNVIHDRQLHDYPSYNASYTHARKSIQQYLEEYPSIRLVLDLHRDASGDNSNQMTTSAVVDGERSAQIMLVVAAGTEARPVPNWQENLALGLKLHVQLERTSAGICRYVNLRASRFNQDLSPGAILVEVGAAGNTHPEAIKAAEVLAEAIIALKHGANLP